MPKWYEGIIASLAIVMFAFAVLRLGVLPPVKQRSRKTIPKAINAVPFRILLFYVLTIFILMCIFPWQQIGHNGSPFVQIFPIWVSIQPLTIFLISG